MSISIVTHEDNMQMMARYPDKFFDLAVVDPPYGINTGKQKGFGFRKGQRKITTYKVKRWDNAIPDDAYFIELFRVSKHQIIWGANYFTTSMPPSMGWIVYDKLQPEGVSFAMAELAFSSFDRSIRTFKTSRSNMQNCISNNDGLAIGSIKIHPTQKPIALYTWLLQNYAKPGEKILDTHLGSGSSRIAAHDLGFDFYGCELDKEYYEAQEKRFKQHISQQKLFTPINIHAEQSQLF